MRQIQVPQKYIGIPFKANGKGFDGADCIRLAKLFVEGELGVRVRQMPADIGEAQKRVEQYRQLLEPVMLHQLEPGDVAFFEFPGRGWHCGVYVGYGKILHTIKPIFPGARAVSHVTAIRPVWRQYYIGAIRTAGKAEIVVPEAGELGVVLLIISLAISIFSVVSALTAPKPKFGGDVGSPRYGFDAIRNTRSNMLIYPFHFGKNKYGGNIIWEENSGDVIKRFILLGVGPIESVSDVRVNDIDITTLPGCSYDAYLGTPNQAVDSRAAGAVKGLRNLAYLAVTLQTSDQLPGGDPVVTCQVEGLKMKTWGGASWSGETYSRNLAACIRKLLIIPREDGGPGMSESEINDDSFGEVYDYCAALIDDGEGGTHARHQFDFVFDEEKPVIDALKEVLQTYGMFLLVGEQVSLKILKEESSSYDYGESDIIADSFKYYETSKNERYNEVIVRYSDPDQNDVAVEVKAVNAKDQAVTGSVRTGEFNYLAVTRFAEASRRAEFIKNESNVNNVICEFDVNIESLHNTIGDVISVTHELPAWTQKLFRIIEISENPDFTRHIIAKEETASIHNDAAGSVIQAYDYGSPPNPYAPVTEVTGLTAAESAYYLHKDGTAASDIILSWTAPADATAKFLRRYVIDYKESGGDYKTVGTTRGTGFTIPAVEEGKTYVARVRTESINEIFSDGAESASLTILGKEQPPEDVAGFEVYQEGGLLRFTWDAVGDPDLARYVIKQGPDWDSATAIGEKVDSTEFVYPVGSIGEQTFMIKAIDQSGNESDNPAVDVITVTTPPDMNFVNNLYPWALNKKYVLSATALEMRNDYNANYVRPVIALATQETWEEWEAGGGTWEDDEANVFVDLDTAVEASGYFEQVQPYDLEAVFEFKLVIDASYNNVTGGTLTVQISTSEDGSTWSSLADVAAGTLYRARYIKFKYVLATTDTAYNLYFYDCTIYLTAPVTRTAWFRDVAIPDTGKSIVFDAGFTAPPRVIATIVNGVFGIIKVSNKTTSGCDIEVTDASDTPIGTAELDIDAKGY